MDENGVLAPRVVNAAAASVWGVELELAWQPDFLDGLFLSASYTYLDAKYDEFTDLTRPVTVTLGGERLFKGPVVPDLGVMLEDLRQRADRQHPFWAVVEGR